MTDQSPTQVFHASSFLQGHNADYIEQLHARYADNPGAVDASWQAFFNALGDTPAEARAEATGPSWARADWPPQPKDDLTNALDGQWPAEPKPAGAKIAAVLPGRMLDTGALYAWGSPQTAEGIDLGLVRQAIREERKLTLVYADQTGAQTQRIIRPLALIYYAAHSTLVGWCELRGAIRNFRTDRVLGATLLADDFKGQGDALRALWVQSWAPG